MVVTPYLLLRIRIIKLLTRIGDNKVKTGLANKMGAVVFLISVPEAVAIVETHKKEITL